MRGRKIITVEGLSVQYGEDVILRDVSLEVYEGEILVIAGGSGSGKSTLLRHMIGLAMPSEGRVVINGVDITTAPEEQLVTLRRGIGMLFQSGALLGSMTVAENVALPLSEFTGLPESIIDKMVRVKLAMVGLAGYENHFPGELSGGMKKRAGIARAIALDPHVLFLDEPYAGLDPITSAGLDELIKRINQGMGTTIVIVSHELEAIFSVAHRIIMLDKSKKGIIAEGDPRVLKEKSPDPHVRHFFNRQAEEKAGAEERGV
ncbi:MAG: Methionine import ATP-binding protein MetN [Syntrophorhabdaceae bacterium PtaU1.Bin034]|nr:MAG: Methionine import ATP-binding protein MetN [Syntrophorhabdaceae bacterium PtaU1.Bin034]